MICKEVRVTERAHAGEEARRRGGKEEKWITEVKEGSKSTERAADSLKNKIL